MKESYAYNRLIKRFDRIATINECASVLGWDASVMMPQGGGPARGDQLAVLAGMAYGTALAGFVPLGAIMATLAPESRGAAMSIMNLGSGLSTFIGPAIAGVFLPLLGVSGVIWIFAFMYLTAAVISYTLRIPGVRALR